MQLQKIKEFAVNTRDKIPFFKQSLSRNLTSGIINDEKLESDYETIQMDSAVTAIMDGEITPHGSCSILHTHDIDNTSIIARQYIGRCNNPSHHFKIYTDDEKILNLQKEFKDTCFLRGFINGIDGRKTFHGFLDANMSCTNGSIGFLVTQFDFEKKAFSIVKLHDFKKAKERQEKGEIFLRLYIYYPTFVAIYRNTAKFYKEKEDLFAAGLITQEEFNLLRPSYLSLKSIFTYGYDPYHNKNIEKQAELIRRTVTKLLFRIQPDELVNYSYCGGFAVAVPALNSIWRQDPKLLQRYFGVKRQLTVAAASMGANKKDAEIFRAHAARRLQDPNFKMIFYACPNDSLLSLGEENPFVPADQLEGLDLNNYIEMMKKTMFLKYTYSPDLSSNFGSKECNYFQPEHHYERGMFGYDLEIISYDSFYLKVGKKLIMHLKPFVENNFKYTGKEIHDLGYKSKERLFAMRKRKNCRKTTLVDIYTENHHRGIIKLIPKPVYKVFKYGIYFVLFKCLMALDNFMRTKRLIKFFKAQKYNLA